MSKNLFYLPLGGAGEIGMNMYVYGYGEKGRERLIVVDAGVTFPNMDTSPGVDLIMADPAFLIERKDQIEAVFVTHAHEDHVGAVGMLMQALGDVDVPIYARAFTAEIARGKMDRFGQDPKRVVVVDHYPESLNVGGFEVSFVPISHSIPESSALLIEVDGQRILHTGDFKMDRTPLVGEAFDDALFEEIGAKGVDVLVCDSTNVFSNHDGRSEASLQDNIHGLIASAKGLVVATTFASNVARVRTLAQAGVRAGRQVILVGRSMNTMVSTAHKTKVLEDMPPIQAPEDYNSSNRSKTLVICTGSQGESRAASAWLARDGYMGIKMQEDDLFIYSSKTIPGNERAVAVVLNELAMRGVDVVHNDDRYHVSGHANRPDLLHMQKLLQPRAVIPMHGEFRHLRELQKHSKEAGRASIIAPNGVMVGIDPKGLSALDEIETGRRYLDGKIMVGAMDGVVRARLDMARKGHISVLVNIEQNGKSWEPSWVMLAGLAEQDRDGTDIAQSLEMDVDNALSELKASGLRNDDQVEEVVQKTLKRSANQFYGKKPWVNLFITRFDA